VPPETAGDAGVLQCGLVNPGDQEKPTWCEESLVLRERGIKVDLMD